MAVANVQFETIVANFSEVQIFVDLYIVCTIDFQNFTLTPPPTVRYDPEVRLQIRSHCMVNYFLKI